MAQYDSFDQDGDMTIRARGRGEYRIKQRPSSRFTLLEIDDDGDENEVLFAADIAIIERFLVGVLIL